MSFVLHFSWHGCSKLLSLFWDSVHVRVAGKKNVVVFLRRKPLEDPMGIWWFLDESEESSCWIECLRHVDPLSNKAPRCFF